MQETPVQLHTAESGTLSVQSQPFNPVSAEALVAADISHIAASLAEAVGAEVVGVTVGSDVGCTEGCIVGLPEGILLG